MKNTTERVLISVLAAALVAGMLPVMASAVSIGVSPAEISFNNVLKGGYAENTLSISTSSEEEIGFRMSASGEISGWIRFEPSENLLIDRGSMKSVSVIVEPPEEAANGLYSGSIVISAVPSGTGEGTGVDVTAGTASAFTVRVTGDEVKSANVDHIDVSDTEEGNPVEFSVSVSNTGNVIVKPLIEIDIIRDGETVETISRSDTGVLPTKMRIIRIISGTDGMDVGSYEADVKVSLDGKTLSERRLSFDILERGTLSKTGVLDKIWNEPWVMAGDVVKIDAYFRNTGEMVVVGNFKAEVYEGERLVEIVGSEEAEVPRGKTEVMSTYFSPEFPGRYNVMGKVYYGGKSTGTKESVVNVRSRESSEMRETGGFFVIVAVIILIVAVAALVFWKKFR